METIHLSLINSIEEAVNFSEHPVRAFDPFYTRDKHLFNTNFDDFLFFLKGLLASNTDSHSLNYINNLYYDCIFKIMIYEKATGNSLLASPRSYFNELYSLAFSNLGGS